MVALDIEKAWYHKEKPVITGFSLQVPTGEIATITGVSGVGKSTLLHIVAGLHHDFVGQVETGEGKIALIPQKKCLLPWKTTWENIVLLAQAAGESPCRQTAMELLEQLGLSAFADTYPGNLSGGQYQRVVFGQALFCQPAILLMDEPFSALDRDTKAEMRSLFSSIHKQRPLTVLFVTHDDEEAFPGQKVRLSG